MTPKIIEKNMKLRRPQSKMTLLWCPENTDNLWFFVKITLIWYPKILNNIYLRRRQGKITLLRYPKNTDNLWYFVKITLLWCPKILTKNMYLRRRQVFVKIILPTKMPENIEKNMCLRRRQGKNTLLWCLQITDNLWYFVKITLLWFPKILSKEKSPYYSTQNIQIIYEFLLKTRYCDARKYWIKHVFKTSPTQKHPVMIPKNYSQFVIFC